MSGRTFPSLINFPLPFFAIEDTDGGAAFVEQPGDREPEGGAAPAPEGDQGGEGGGGDEGASGDAGDEGGGAPVGDGQGDDAGSGESGDAGDDGDGDGAASEGEPEPVTAKKPSWKDRQIIKLRQQLKDQATELGKLKGADTKTAPDTSLPPPQTTDGQDLVPRAQAEEAALQRFRNEQRVSSINTRADAMYDAGAAAFPKTWKARVDEAAEALGPEISGRDGLFLDVITDLPNAAQVYYELAGDLDNLERVLALPAAKMGMELASLSAKLATPKPRQGTSKAPAPIKPLDTTTTDELALDDPNLSQEEFNRRMDAEDAKRYANRRR